MTNYFSFFFNINNINNMKGKTNVVCTSFISSSIFQFIFFSVAIAFIYLKTIHFDYNLDDYIIFDSLDGKVNNFNDLWSLFKLSYNKADYRPIVFFSFGIEKLFLGEYIPGVSHAINCILYFLVCISGLKLFRLLFTDEHQLVLFFAVLLFSIHPINTEVVCSIKCRDNLLSMLFGLNSTIFFIQFLNNKKILYLFISFLFSMIAILSKLDAMGFLILNILYTLFYLKKERKYLIFIALLLFIATVFLQDYLRNNLMIKNLQSPLVAKVTFTENPLAILFTLPNRIIAGLNTIYFYFTKFTYASSSKYYYGYNYYDVLSTKSISIIGGIIVLSYFILAFIYGIIKKETIITISIIGVVSTSIYALNILQPVAGIIADRYIFIANLFFCLFIIYSISILFQYLKISKHTYTVITVIVLIFSIVSFVRVNAWKNFRTLINTDGPKLYNSYEAMRIAASAYFDEYKITQDTSDLNQAILYAEKGNIVYPKNVLLHLLIGQFYFKKNKYRNAISNFVIASNNDTSLSESLVYLGDTYYSLKNLDSSLFYYQKAFIHNPKNPELINNISTIYFEKGEKEKCLQYNFDLIKSDSTLFAAYENLGYYYLSERDTIKAKSYFKQGEKHGLKPVDISALH